jgi:hypothetical protein
MRSITTRRFQKKNNNDNKTEHETETSRSNVEATQNELHASIVVCTFCYGTRSYTWEDAPKQEVNNQNAARNVTSPKTKNNQWRQNKSKRKTETSNEQQQEQHK